MVLKFATRFPRRGLEQCRDVVDRIPALFGSQFLSAKDGMGDGASPFVISQPQIFWLTAAAKCPGRSEVARVDGETAGVFKFGASASIVAVTRGALRLKLFFAARDAGGVGVHSLRNSGGFPFGILNAGENPLTYSTTALISS